MVHCSPNPRANSLVPSIGSINTVKCLYARASICVAYILISRTAVSIDETNCSGTGRWSTEYGFSDKLINASSSSPECVDAIEDGCQCEFETTHQKLRQSR